MTEDLNYFRKVVIQVYDTMTQDVSDVLANEQMELAKMYDEKHRIILNKVMQNYKEIKEIHPDFNFDQYYANPEQYVNDAYEVPEVIIGKILGYVYTNLSLIPHASLDSVVRLHCNLIPVIVV